MQMNQKSRLGLAAAIVAVMVLLVAVFGYRERPGTVAGAESPWLPELKQQLGELRRLRLQSSAETVTLARTDAGWGVEERAGYPADFRQLETLLEALASARLVEQKTAKPEFFDRLGLVDIEQPASEAVQLEIWNAGEQPFVRVLLGKAAEGRNGRYVRAVSEQQTWLIDTSPEPMTNPADWLERKLLDVDFSRVASVEPRARRHARVQRGACRGRRRAARRRCAAGGQGAALPERLRRRGARDPDRRTGGRAQGGRARFHGRGRNGDRLFRRAESHRAGDQGEGRQLGGARRRRGCPGAARGRARNGAGQRRGADAGNRTGPMRNLPTRPRTPSA